jgi:hypothetical protein
MNQKFSHTNFEVAHSGHSGPYAQNSMRLFIYSWAPTISTILDRDPWLAVKTVPLLDINSIWLKTQSFYNLHPWELPEMSNLRNKVESKQIHNLYISWIKKMEKFYKMMKVVTRRNWLERIFNPRCLDQRIKTDLIEKIDLDN